MGGIVFEFFSLLCQVASDGAKFGGPPKLFFLHVFFLSVPPRGQRRHREADGVTLAFVLKQGFWDHHVVKNAPLKKTKQTPQPSNPTHTHTDQCKKNQRHHSTLTRRPRPLQPPAMRAAGRRALQAAPPRAAAARSAGTGSRPGRGWPGGRRPGQTRWCAGRPGRRRAGEEEGGRLSPPPPPPPPPPSSATYASSTPGRAARAAASARRGAFSWKRPSPMTTTSWVRAEVLPPPLPPPPLSNSAPTARSASAAGVSPTVASAANVNPPTVAARAASSRGAPNGWSRDGPLAPPAATTARSPNSARASARPTDATASTANGATPPSATERESSMTRTMR